MNDDFLRAKGNRELDSFFVELIEQLETINKTLFFIAKKIKDGDSKPKFASAELLTPAQVAQRFPGLSEGYLQKLRGRGNGPAYSKPTKRRVLYAVSDIETWLSASRASSTSEGR